MASVPDLFKFHMLKMTSYRAFQCNGLATIVSGFLQFAVAHAKTTGHPNQWQWLMVATTIITFIVASLFLTRFPDNPTTAKFLTEEEKVKAVKRIRDNRSGIETKIWKRYQLVRFNFYLFDRYLTDPQTT
jgi:MFS transporter, ACS family, allantoate permease